LVPAPQPLPPKCNVTFPPNSGWGHPEKMPKVVSPVGPRTRKRRCPVRRNGHNRVDPSGWNICHQRQSPDCRITGTGFGGPPVSCSRPNLRIWAASVPTIAVKPISGLLPANDVVTLAKSGFSIPDDGRRFEGALLPAINTVTNFHGAVTTAEMQTPNILWLPEMIAVGNR